jgi:primase-polymerase (primpol)-like protein
MTITTPNDPGNSAPLTIEALANDRLWVAWQLEKAGERITKVPYSTPPRKARANDRTTWTTMVEAFTNYQRLPLPYDQGGIGIELGMLDDDRAGRD